MKQARGTDLSEGVEILVAPQPDGTFAATTVFYGFRYVGVGPTEAEAYLDVHDKVWSH